MKYHETCQTKILLLNKFVHKKYLKTPSNSVKYKLAMSQGPDKKDKKVVVTLLSTGASNLFKDDSLTLSLNKSHTSIISNPSNYNYIALQEMGISLNSGNIRTPYGKPAIIYFEWDTTFRYHFEDFSNYEIRKQVFKTSYEQNKNHFFINSPNKFLFLFKQRIYRKSNLPTKHNSRKLKKLELFPENFFQGKLEFNLFKEFLEEKSSIDRNVSPCGNVLK